MMMTYELHNRVSNMQKRTYVIPIYGVFLCASMVPVADTGFPIGGVDLVGGAWTPETVTF